MNGDTAMQPQQQSNTLRAIAYYGPAGAHKLRESLAAGIVGDDMRKEVSAVLRENERLKRDLKQSQWIRTNLERQLENSRTAFVTKFGASGTGKHDDRYSFGAVMLAWFMGALIGVVVIATAFIVIINRIV